MPTISTDLQNFHNNVLHMMTHPNWTVMLDELSKNATSRTHAKADPLKFIKDHSIPVPAGMNASYQDGSFYLKVCCFGWCATISKQ